MKWCGRLFLFLVLSSPAVALPNWWFWYDETESQLQSDYNYYNSQGYRLTSLSVYGGSASPLYAAVWVQRPGPAWFEVDSLSETNYKSYVGIAATYGYYPVIVSATGSGSSALFAGVFEQRSVPTIEKDGLVWGDPTSTGTIDYWYAWANNHGYLVRWASVYGSSAAPVYAVILEQNPNAVAWNARWAVDPATYSSISSAEVAGWARPSFVTMSDSQQYLGTFRDDSLGAFVPFYNLTPSGFNTIWNQYSNTYYPLVIQVAGTGSGERLAGIWVQGETVASRAWTATGSEGSGMGAFDDAMKAYMTQNGIRAGSLAVAKDGRLVLARGYTWAEGGYPATQPTSLFRIASCSKSLTSIRIHQEEEYPPPLLTSGECTNMQSVLGLTYADGSGPVDSRFNQIQMWHLLTHSGGWNREQVGDAARWDIGVAGAFNVPLPVSRLQNLRYMVGKPLQFAPGSDLHYSNIGYMALGEMIRTFDSAPGYQPSYADSMDYNVFWPLGVTRPLIGATLLSGAASGEVRYHSQTALVTTSLVSASQPWVPSPYGGTNIGKVSSAGGWVLAAPDYAKVLAAFDRNPDPLLSAQYQNLMFTLSPIQDPKNPTYERGWQGLQLAGVANGGWVNFKNGKLDGTAALVEHRADGVSIVAFFNTDTPGYLWAVNEPLGDSLNTAATNMVSWPSGDLFPTYGIPSFQ